MSARLQQRVQRLLEGKPFRVPPDPVGALHQSRYGPRHDHAPPLPHVRTRLVRAPPEQREIGPIETRLEIGPVGLVLQNFGKLAMLVGDTVILRYDRIAMQ